MLFSRPLFDCIQAAMLDICEFVQGRLAFDASDSFSACRLS